VTNGKDLEAFAREFWPEKFKGVVLGVPPPLKDDGFVIVWKENQGSRVGHWFIAYRKGKTLGEIDSYEEDRLGPKYKDFNIPDSQRQGANGVDNADCGQRGLLWVSKIFPPEKFFS
jgi:hypothetical protein